MANPLDDERAKLADEIARTHVESALGVIAIQFGKLVMFLEANGILNSEQATSFTQPGSRLAASLETMSGLPEEYMALFHKTVGIALGRMADRME